MDTSVTCKDTDISKLTRITLKEIWTFLMRFISIEIEEWSIDSV